MKTSVTMMYGLGESDADRIEHLIRIRDLQARTGGFTAFIAWPLQPEGTEMAAQAKTDAVTYLRTLAMLKENGWSPRRCCPHGGHQMSLNIAAGLGLGGNESYPGIFAPFGGFADNTPVIDGRVSLPDLPGIGIEAKADLHARLRRLH